MKSHFVMVVMLCILYLAIVSTESALYRIIGIDIYGNIVSNCSYPCFESNCSIVAKQAMGCEDVSWIAFAPSSRPCKSFSNWIKDSNVYTVFAVDNGRRIIRGTTQTIPNYFVEAEIYGCGLLTIYQNAMWFGMIIS